ncbi:hypothetical protein R3P38DRAFT_794145 [Favolaschia claudopus]|uniref:Uncharacterized protein n=1 Tax=Favolaschia claudopus TaxID=2862362 RepID=A0AAW0C2J9_9AGAR
MPLKLSHVLRPLLPETFRGAALATMVAATVIWLSLGRLLDGRSIFSSSQIFGLQKTLLSRVTNNTPISGFYGPGAWWAFLITLGMTHGHSIMAIMKTGHLSSEWDYDLIGASSYTVAAAIDLISKSKAIADLGDEASNSTMIPALVCAERVVWMGTGSSLFTLAVALFYRPYRFHTIGIAAMPTLFAIIVSAYCLRAHRAIASTEQVVWCPHPPRPEEPSEGRPFSLAPRALYCSWQYWALEFAVAGACVLLFFIGRLWFVRSARRALLGAIGLGFMAAVVISLLPALLGTFMLFMLASLWVFPWVILWLVIYPLGFFPQLSFFPPTRISVLELDQLAALAAVFSRRSNSCLARGFRGHTSARAQRGFCRPRPASC